MYYWNQQILYALMLLTIFLCSIAIYNIFMHKCICNIICCKNIIKMIIYNNLHKQLIYILYATCCWLILWIVELLPQLRMQNMTTECSYNLSYTNSSNIYTLTTASHLYKARWGQTDRPILWLIELLSQLKSHHSNYFELYMI